MATMTYEELEILAESAEDALQDVFRGFDKVAERIYHYPEVNALYLISGGFDFMVIIEGKTLREVAEFVSSKLSPMESILSTKTNFILKKYKDYGTIMQDGHKDERELILP